MIFSWQKNCAKTCRVIGFSWCYQFGTLVFGTQQHVPTLKVSVLDWTTAYLHPTQIYFYQNVQQLNNDDGWSEWEANDSVNFFLSHISDNPFGKFLMYHLNCSKIVQTVTKSSRPHSEERDAPLSLPLPVWYSFTSLLASYMWLADSVSWFADSMSLSVCWYPGSSWMYSVLSVSTDVSKCVSIFGVGRTCSHEPEKKNRKREEKLERVHWTCPIRSIGFLLFVFARFLDEPDSELRVYLTGLLSQLWNVLPQSSSRTKSIFLDT